MIASIHDFSSIMRNRCNFRLSVTMDSVAYESILSKSLCRVIPRFDHKSNSKIEFRLSCHSRQIVLDAFGADCNCDDAVVFLITLVAEYVRNATKKTIECSGSVLDPDEKPTGNELAQGPRRICLLGNGILESTRYEIPITSLMEIAASTGKSIWDIVTDSIRDTASKGGEIIPETINLTVRDIPESLLPHIKGLDFIPGRTSRKSRTCSLLCFGNVMILNVTRRGNSTGYENSLKLTLHFL